ncbi:MAG: D-alanyl-D-alanine carboxypeptidase/D-alanyl-D-alanine-endopeptidase [Myxococcales bacterium]|nr:D-alanyl-D-alanine carboxypeptidase/D-alanyl-D-alanine-endopeptidase [Myxococcales bacterium]
MRASMSVLLVLSAVTAAAAPSREQERRALKAAMQSVIEQSPLGTARVTVQVKSLDDGTVVFARDENELLNPASNVKLFTAAAALTQLGTEYRFETEFLTPTEFKEGKAKILYIRGKGDPTITTERLYGIVAELLHAGLKEVQDIVVDDTWFDPDREPPGYDQETGDKAYLAPTGALSLNWNTVGVYLRPGETVGSEAAVELEPASDYFVVEGKVATGTRTQRRFNVTSGMDKQKQKISVEGVVPVDKGAWSAWKKIDQPAIYFGYTVKELLKQRGVKVKGRIRPGAVPPGQKVLYVAASDTLDIVLKKLNKHSSNFVAEQLIKTLGAEKRGAPGSTARGIDVVEAFLASEVGLARGSFVMKNGSGLNDANRFSAAQTNRLLTYMANNFPLAPEYLSALGIAGKDGTLKYRFDGSDAVGRLRAKTGTLENVSALSGYVQAVGGERFVFSVMVNDFPGRASTVVRHIDALGAAVAAFGSASGPSAAVASMTRSKNVVGPFAELRSRMKTYVTLAQKGERRSVPFLRTAWRSETDPALRAVIADTLYQLEPREASSAWRLLESAVATDDVYGRLRKAAEADGLDVPVLPSLVELASAGNVDAAARLIEFVRASESDAGATDWLSEQLTVVATDAPQELLLAFKSSAQPDRDAAIDALVRGLVKAAQPDAPLWPTLREAQGSADPALVAFSRQLEATLSQKIAEARAPSSVVSAPAAPSPQPPASDPAQSVPGG